MLSELACGCVKTQGAIILLIFRAAKIRPELVCGCRKTQGAIILFFILTRKTEGNTWISDESKQGRWGQRLDRGHRRAKGSTRHSKDIAKDQLWKMLLHYVNTSQTYLAVSPFLQLATELLKYDVGLKQHKHVPRVSKSVFLTSIRTQMWP